MASVDVGGPREHGKGKGGRRPKRRIGVRIDMTPMVDIAFLLLIFYMVTTVFAAPQAMDISLPKESEDSTSTIDVKKSNLCVIRVDSLGRLWWTIGDEKGDSRTIRRETLYDSLVLYNSKNPFLSTLFKIHPKAKFSAYVDILDDFGRVEETLKRDTAFVQKYIRDNKKVLGETKFTDTTFSYRYTTTPWNDRKDGRAVEISDSVMRARGERVM